MKVLYIKKQTLSLSLSLSLISSSLSFSLYVRHKKVYTERLQQSAI